MPLSSRRLFSVFAPLALSVACSGKDPYSPGTKLGTFHVTAALTNTTCGATPNPWEFDVKLNHDGAVLYWLQGGAPVEGRVDATASAKLTTTNVTDVRPADERRKKAACAIARQDALGVSLSDEQAKPAVDPGTLRTFLGTLVYRFTPTEGSDCSDQLTGSGGDFDALPCEVSYELKAVRTVAPSP